MVLCSNDSSKAFHAFAHKHPGKVGWLFGPSSYKTPRDYLPFALDNDAYAAWKNGTEWNRELWIAFMEKVKATGKTPLWVLVPDKVADRNATLGKWNQFSPVVSKFGWPLAFAAQDGMTPDDVPNNAEIVFIGGTTTWKWRTLPMWTKHFPRVHVGRVTTGTRLEIAERCGAESVDGTGFFRESFGSPRSHQLIHFIEGHRNQNMTLNLSETENCLLDTRPRP